MTRIGTYQHGQTVLADLMRNQGRVFQAQRQVASGRRADHFKDIPRDAPTLLSAKTVLQRSETYVQTNQTLRLRLEAYDVNLRALEQVGADLRQAVLDAIGASSGLGLAEKVDALFHQATGLLNARFGGSYIFGGTNTEQPPVDTTTVAGLIGLAEPPAAAFDNNRQVLGARTSDSETLQYGLLADDIGLDLLEAMQRTLMFANGILPAGAAGFTPAGPFADQMTSNERDFLAGELTRLESVAADLTTHTSNNGIRLGLLEATQRRHEEQMTFTKTFITEIEDVDIAEAITRMNQDQLALESSMGVMAQISRLSLLDFL